MDEARRRGKAAGNGRRRVYDQGVFVHPPRWLGTVRGLSLLFYPARDHPIPRITASTVACCRPRETSSHFLIEIAATLVACGPTQKGKIRGRVICTPCPALLTNASPHNETRPTPYQLSNYKVWAPPRSRKSTFICN